MRRSGSSLAQVERKARKLEREVGALRFEFHSQDPAVFSSLLDWKTAQYRRTRRLEILATSWVVNLLETVRQTDTPGFGGPLSALYAGDQLVAVHLGLRSRTALHIWFPAYNLRFERFSPGLVLLLRLAEACAARGMARIDFGHGEERYKSNFKTGHIAIAEGAVGRGFLRSTLHATWYRTKRLIRSSRWRRQLEAPLVASQKFRQWVAFR